VPALVAGDHKASRVTSTAACTIQTHRVVLLTFPTEPIARQVLTALGSTQGTMAFGTTWIGLAPDNSGPSQRSIVEGVAQVLGGRLAFGLAASPR
jgi:hypothetical protein